MLGDKNPWNAQGKEVIKTFIVPGSFLSARSDYLNILGVSFLSV